MSSSADPAISGQSRSRAARRNSLKLAARSGLEEGKRTVELFRGVNVDWLGKKWYFLGFSLIFSVAGMISMGCIGRSTGSPVPLGVDFRGGTEVQVQFQNAPDISAIRQAMDAAGIKDAKIQSYRRDGSSNEVLISLPEQHDETALDAGRQQIVTRCTTHYDNPFDRCRGQGGRGGPHRGPAVGKAGAPGHALFAAGHAGLSLVPLSVDLRRGGGGCLSSMTR